jgi:hypothetical protein
MLSARMSCGFRNFYNYLLPRQAQRAGDLWPELSKALPELPIRRMNKGKGHKL